MESITPLNPSVVALNDWVKDPKNKKLIVGKDEKTREYTIKSIDIPTGFFTRILSIIWNKTRSFFGFSHLKKVTKLTNKVVRNLTPNEKEQLSNTLDILADKVDHFNNHWYRLYNIEEIERSQTLPQSQPIQQPEDPLT